MGSQKINHPEFARRLEQACDGNPDVPPINYGRLVWFADRIVGPSGKNISNETVRKYFAGEVMPRPKQMSQLAKILKVDESWLALGAHPGLTEREKKVRNATADGVVNLVAGMVRMFGGNPAFPAADDKFAKENCVDLYAIIRGAQYAMHIVLFDEDGKATIPAQAKDAFILGVEHTGGTNFRLYDLTGFEEVANRKSGAFEVTTDARDWKIIDTFSERL